jgi:tetratricopeptide (TPR) repeat protein
MTAPMNVHEFGDPRPLESAPSWKPVGRVSRRFLLVILAVASALGLGWIIRGQHREPASATTGTRGTAASEPGHAPVRPLASGGSAPLRQPAIRLVDAAVPATAEMLNHEAEGVTSDLLARYPELAEALNVAAMFHAQLRRTGEAERLWRKCIELDATQAAYYVNLAAVAMDRGNSELAAKTLRQALEAGCTTPDVYHHLSVALTSLGACEEAEQIATAALVRYPRSSSHWLVLGEAQLKIGKAVEAETSLRRAMALGNRTAEIHFALANACARQGKQDEADRHRQLYSELKASLPVPAQHRFQILSAAEARRNAVAILTEAAAVHARKGESMEAERLLLRAIALDPSSVPSCHALAGLYHAAGMLMEERVVRRRLVETEPQTFDNYLNLAKVSAQLGEPEEAEAALKLAMSIRPDAVDAFATLAQLYLQQNRIKPARWYAQEAVRRMPSAEGYSLLATTCRLMGDDAGAEAAMTMAHQLKSNNSAK